MNLFIKEILEKLKIRGLSIVILSVSATISIVLLLVLKYHDKLDIVNGISVFGSIASLAGILIAYFQILSVKKLSESTNEKINNALGQLFKSISISDISKSIKLVQEVQSFIRAEKVEAALLRMHDLKSLLIQIKHIVVLNDMYDNEDYKTLLVNLNIDIANINMSLIKKKNGISFVKICENLELIITFFTELENKLKYNRNE